MDFSSYVTIINKTHYNLTQVEQHADHGYFVTNAPNNISSAYPLDPMNPDKNKGYLQIMDHDNDAVGSGGHVTYSVDGLNVSIELISGCPYSDNNYASINYCPQNADNLIFVRYKGTNGGDPNAQADWGDYPSEGHPLSIEFELLEVPQQ